MFGACWFSCSSQAELGRLWSETCLGLTGCHPVAIDILFYFLALCHTHEGLYTGWPLPPRVHYFYLCPNFHSPHLGMFHSGVLCPFLIQSHHNWHVQCSLAKLIVSHDVTAFVCIATDQMKIWRNVFLLWLLLFLPAEKGLRTMSRVAHLRIVCGGKWKIEAALSEMYAAVRWNSFQSMCLWYQCWSPLTQTGKLYLSSGRCLHFIFHSALIHGIALFLWCYFYF